MKRGAPRQQAVCGIGDRGCIADAGTRDCLYDNRGRDSGSKGVGDEGLDYRERNQAVGGYVAGAAGNQFFLWIEGEQVDAQVL